MPEISYEVARVRARCDRCAVYAPTGGDMPHGTCRRHAPVPVSRDSLDDPLPKARFPRVNAYDWCGEWAPRWAPDELPWL